MSPPSVTPLGAPLQPLGGALYLAAEGFEAELRTEMRERCGADLVAVGATGRLFFSSAPAVTPTWAANVWRNPVRVDAATPAKAASLLRALGRGKCTDWVLFGDLSKRAHTLAQLFPQRMRDPLRFPTSGEPARPGSWMLASDTEILASAECDSPFPNGEAAFVEDHKNPPSRAYRKLWEALVLAGAMPKPGDRCVDLGSSPGGWTWALERLGARVTSVDKADIAPELRALTRVRYLKESAFALDPASVGHVDWVCSDVICYPDRALRLIEHWMRVHPHAGFVITIKLQGDAHAEILRALREVPAGRLVHLHHNRHELTWIRKPVPPVA